MITFGLKGRLIGLGLLTVCVPLCAIAVLSWVSGSRGEARITAETRAMVDEHFERTVLGVVELAGLAQAQLEAQLEVQCGVAEEVLRRLGGLNLDPAARTEWSARNQFTQETSTVRLPKARLGQGAWLGSNTSFGVESPLVDEVSRAAGGVATLFLRMDEGGSLLRVATTVKTENGERAAGTYIPHTNPDGKPNAVASSIVRGEVFRGRAMVVGQWMITAYIPIKDERGEVVGAVFAGLPEKDAFDRIRQVVTAMRPGGETGRVEVFNAQGARR